MCPQARLYQSWIHLQSTSHEERYRLQGRGEVVPAGMGRGGRGDGDVSFHCIKLPVDLEKG